jgi:hypothetical protein
VPFLLFRLIMAGAGVLRLPVPNTCLSFTRPVAVALGRCGFVVLAGVTKGVLDASLGDGVLAVEALRVDLEQDGHAVPGPLGYLGRRDAAVEPGGDAGVA